ncbi:MAG: 6,7-dimethyl-8-ribityllumazine synthase [Acidimicrobiia bacterium]
MTPPDQSAREFAHDAAAIRLPEARVGIVCSRFNEFIVRALLDGARRGLARCGVTADRVDVAWVPGAYEIPIVVREMARSGRYDALVALGAVIRGETAHFEYVAGPCADGVARVQLDTGVPVGFGVLTTEDVAQATARSGPGAGNKGDEAAVGALETLLTLRAIRSSD